jgi:hypothetical protein
MSIRAARTKHTHFIGKLFHVKHRRSPRRAVWQTGQKSRSA